LESRDTFKIVWRAFSSEKEEKEKKDFLLKQLKAEEDEKRNAIYERLDLEDNMKTISNQSENF